MGTQNNKRPNKSPTIRMKLCGSGIQYC